MSYRELTDKQVMAAAMDYQEANMSCYRAVIAADRALNAPADLEHQSVGKPVAWLLTDKNINDIQIGSVQRLIDRARQAHFTDLIIRINGKDEHYQADWLKHLVRAEVPVCAPADRDVTREAPVTVLPDGSAFFTGSLPLPKDHWLYAPRCAEWDDARDTTADTPHPILTHEVRDSVVAAVRYAVRGATSCGAEKDFDPDAIVQNAVYALCGPYGGCTLAASPAPPAEQPIDMVLHCPKCGKQHIDTPEYWGGEVKVHRSHLCVPDAGGCGHIWRPADVPTNGVTAIKTKGKDDSPPPEQQGEHAPIIYKRSEFTKNWTTFNVRREHADAAEARLRAPSLAALRAKVEALPSYATNYYGKQEAMLLRSQALAEIDKMGGKV